MSRGAKGLNSTAYHRNLHRFAVVLAGCAFLLLIAGGLVTSNDAGLAVPDWPTSFGSFRMPAMVGGVKWEHGHRMVAAFVGLLSIVLAIWTWRRDDRRWMRILGVLAVAGIVLQGVLGGLTVLSFLPPAISTAHATLAQTLFCVLAAMALFTSRSWRREPVASLPTGSAPRLKALSIALLASLYVQLVLGAAFRHVWTKWGPNAAHRWTASDIVWTFLAPHVLNALLVIALIVVTTMQVFRHAGESRELRRPAIALHVLLLVQLLLGVLAYLTRVVWQMDAPQPQLPLVLATVAHLATGALLLATAVVLTIQIHRASPARVSKEPLITEQTATA